MGYFDPINIAIFFIDVAMVVHVLRSGRSPMWILAISVASLSGSFLGLLGLLAIPAIWLTYLVTAVIPDFWNSHGTRNFRSGVVKAADSGRAYREKKRQAQLTGSVDAKRALADESLKRGYIDEAVELYESAMQSPIGAGDPALLKGLARAKMQSGDGAAAEALYLQLKQIDPAAVDSDAELDYARALALQGKNEDAIRQFQHVTARYPGEEARARFALLLEQMGRMAEAQALFREIIESVKGAPSYYRSRQREWIKIAKQHLR